MQLPRIRASPREHKRDGRNQNRNRAYYVSHSFLHPDVLRGKDRACSVNVKCEMCVGHNYMLHSIYVKKLGAKLTQHGRHRTRRIGVT